MKQIKSLLSILILMILNVSISTNLIKNKKDGSNDRTPMRGAGNLV